MNRSPITQAVVLVGGLGTRLRPLTYLRPKALLPLLNRPLISYELELFARHGVTDIIMAVSYRAEQIRHQLQDGEQWGVNIRYVLEEDRLDTAGAIKNCQEHIDGPFFACNGDLVYDFNPAEMARFHQQRSAMVTFCLRRVEDISPFGLIQRNEDGSVKAFLEKVEHDETGENTVNAGFYVMEPSVLDEIPDGEPYSNESELFPDLLERGKPMYGWVASDDGYWSDVGRIETYMETHESLLHGVIDWAHTGEESVVIAPDASVAESATIGPDVTIGEGCTVKEEAHIERSIIWPHVTIGAGAQVAHSILATGATVCRDGRIEDEVLVPDHVT